MIKNHDYTSNSNPRHGQEIREALALIPDDEIVSLMVGRPSLSIIARKLQHEAATLGITAAEHDALMASLKLDILTAVNGR